MSQHKGYSFHSSGSQADLRINSGTWYQGGVIAVGAAFEPIEIGTIDLLTWDKGVEDWPFGTVADSDALCHKSVMLFYKVS